MSTKMDTRRFLLVGTLTFFLGLIAMGSILFHVLVNSLNKTDDDEGTQSTMIKQTEYKIAYSARARLYTGYNYTGNSTDVLFVEGDGFKCINLKRKKFLGQIKSIDTFGSCIRLYSTQCCKGQSMAYYPQKIASNNAYGPEVEVGGVHSISPCFQLEQDKAHPAQKNRTKTASKKRVKDGSKLSSSHHQTQTQTQTQVMVPDDLCIGMHCGHHVIGTHRLPVTFYRVGYGGRVEFIWAEIYPDFLPKSDGSTPLRGELFGTNADADKMGHYLGPRLVKSVASLPFENIFAQSSTNARTLRSEEEKVLEIVQNKGRQAWICINIYYDGEDETRPIGFVYRIQQPFESGGDLLVSQNYLSNL